MTNNIIYEVSMYDLEQPPKNKLRKIIFNDTCMLTPSEKLKIVGSIMGRSSRIDSEIIYQCMLDLNDASKQITWSKVAKLLDCSTRTVYRNIGNELKKEKELLNQQLKKDEEI